ncbi:MAG: sulfite oxidase [Chloroflexota bacterium]|nr:sulfite oxidase [Chloroflexota bacterium]
MLNQTSQLTTNGALPQLSRRGLIARLAAAGLSAPAIAAALRQPAVAQEATPAPSEILEPLGKSPDLIQHGTTTFETPIDLMDQFLTPNEAFFIRSNGPIFIDIDPAAWRLTVSGLVETELELTLADLQAMPVHTLTAFLECSGNSRSRFAADGEQAEGTQWGNGAIGNVEWTGVSLRDVLDEAGVQEGVVDVVSTGGDFPEMQRGLPLDHALEPGVMLVWEMNGEALPAPNGGPVRLLVPGWGGIASTKWIVSLELIDRPFDGSFNTESYVFIDPDGTVLRPVREIPAKSVITSPVPDASVTAGAHTIAGFAWSGYAGIDRVEVSIDGGDWQAATITEEAGPASWVRFEFPWEAAAGEHTLRSRATDQIALQQPEEVPFNAKGYLMNAIYEVPVTVA